MDGHVSPYINCSEVVVMRRSELDERISISDIDHSWLIIRDYLMAFWLSAEVSTRDPIISPRALARGLIMVEG